MNTHARPKPSIASLGLAQRLKLEDRDFDQLWRRYWKQRNKWKYFEEFKANAA